MASAVREKIIHMLGHNVAQVVVAEAAGVSPSYISQLLDEEGVRQEIALIRAGLVEEAIRDDTTLEAAERKTLQQLVRKIDGGLMKTDQLINSFKAFNSARRKASANGIGADGPAAGGDMVTISLPRAAQIMIKVNPTNQVIEVEGKSMAPLPSRALPILQRELAKQEATLAIEKPVPAHVTEHVVRQNTADAARAKLQLEDLAVVVDGVRLVI